MKSLNSFVELYKPKSPDEQKFVDKHVVKTRGDANGNGDDVFKGSKVKKVERTKERKGYEPGDDEKVYEEAEQIDEISAKLARKAAAASAAKSFEYGSSAYDDESQKNADRLDKKSDKAYAHVMKRQGQKGVDKTNRLAGKLIYGKSRAFEEAEQIDENFDKSSPSHKTAKELTKSFKRYAKAKYHPDGSATIYTKGDDQVSSVVAVDHLHKSAGLGYNRPAEDYVNSSRKKDGLTFKTKQTKKGYKGNEIDRFETAGGSHEIHITHNGMKEETEQVVEKMHMKTADMGDVITDFQKSDAPQFKGKTKAQRRVMAIAAKLSAERGGKPMKEEVSVEEALENLIADLSESNQRVMFSVFAKLTEENQEKFLAACETEGGVDAMLDFSIKHRNVE